MTTNQEQIQINRAANRLAYLSATEKVKELTPEQKQEKDELQKFLRA